MNYLIIKGLKEDDLPRVRKIIMDIHLYGLIPTSFARSHEDACEYARISRKTIFEARKRGELLSRLMMTIPAGWYDEEALDLLEILNPGLTFTVEEHDNSPETKDEEKDDEATDIVPDSQNETGSEGDGGAS